MKKTILITLLVTLCFSLIACGDSKDEELYPERSIDGIAAYLGYTDGGEIVDVSEQVPGAKACKDFGQGDITIYEFDPLSYQYKDLESQLCICNEGFVLMIGAPQLSDGEMDDLIQRFEKMKFK